MDKLKCILAWPIKLFFASSLLLSSCKSTKQDFGMRVFEFPADTLRTQTEITRIRSLSNTIFDSAAYTGMNDILIQYRLYKPAAAAHKNQKLPLVVVFHGSGAIGTNNQSQLGLLAKMFAGPDLQKKYPAFVLAPQFATRSSDYELDSMRTVVVSVPRNCLQTAIELIDSLKQHLPIDQKRIYAIGYSMGGSTTINAISARPDLFAAGVSIAGIPQFDRMASITHIPLWLIHGRDDTENPIDSDEWFYEELRTKGLIRLWIFENGIHGSA